MADSTSIPTDLELATRAGAASNASAAFAYVMRGYARARARHAQAARALATIALRPIATVG